MWSLARQDAVKTSLCIHAVIAFASTPAPPYANAEICSAIGIHQRQSFWCARSIPSIKDWDDPLKPDVQVILPNPKTSGNGRLRRIAVSKDALVLVIVRS